MLLSIALELANLFLPFPPLPFLNIILWVFKNYSLAKGQIFCKSEKCVLLILQMLFLFLFLVSPGKDEYIRRCERDQERIWDKEDGGCVRDFCSFKARPQPSSPLAGFPPRREILLCGSFVPWLRGLLEVCICIMLLNACFPLFILLRIQSC